MTSILKNLGDDTSANCEEKVSSLSNMSQEALTSAATLAKREPAGQTSSALSKSVGTVCVLPSSNISCQVRMEVKDKLNVVAGHNLLA